MCDRLVARGLIDRSTSRRNRREVTIALTAAGRRLVDRVTAKRRAELATILARVPVRERVALAHALDALGDAAGEPGEPSAPAVL
jgi:DNA-binding MarR family transcriptional regulator